MVWLSTEYIVKNNGHTKKKKDESDKSYLKRLTHLYMSERNIEGIDDLSKCRNLTVLYLYDNKVKRTVNLGTATNLSHLYLQNNNISKIEELKYLTKLTKLYLGHNNLLVIEGLQTLELLKELHVEYQNLPPGEQLLFDPRTLFSLSASLQVLNVSGNRLDSFKSLIPLNKLVELQARDNNISEVESINEALSCWHQLTKLDLSQNPITNTQKYRDHIIIMSSPLENLDGREVSKTERQFLVRWKASREAKRRQQKQESNNDINHQYARHHHSTHSAILNPTAKYIIKGLPSGQKRFEAVLAKSRSLPNSAVAPMQRMRLHGELRMNGDLRNRTVGNRQSRYNNDVTSGVSASPMGLFPKQPTTEVAAADDVDEQQGGDVAPPDVAPPSGEQGDVITSKDQQQQQNEAVKVLPQHEATEVNDEISMNEFLSNQKPDTPYPSDLASTKTQNIRVPNTSPRQSLLWSDPTSVLVQPSNINGGRHMFEPQHQERRKYPTLRGTKKLPPHQNHSRLMLYEDSLKKVAPKSSTKINNALLSGRQLDVDQQFI